MNATVSPSVAGEPERAAPLGARREPVVVTGGTGFIGWHLCERLHAEGHEVRAVVRPSSANPLPAGAFRFDAALDAEQMSPAFQGARVVFHLAGLTRAPDLETFLHVNAEGARQAALAARDAGAFLVLVSSQAAAGPGTPSNPRAESDLPAPVSDYGRSKLEGERRVTSVEGLRWATVRPPGVYGPRDTDFLALFRMAARGWFPLLGAPDKAYTLAHVDDVVSALLAVGGAGASGSAEVRGETFFVGWPQPITQLDLSREMERIAGRRLRRVPVPAAILRAIAEAGELQTAISGRPALVNRSRYRELTAPGFVCEVDKIERRLGVRAAVPPADGLAATADWYRTEGWL